MAKKNPQVDSVSGVTAAQVYMEANIGRLPSFASRDFHPVKGGSARDIIDWSHSPAKSRLVLTHARACRGGEGAPNQAAILQAHYGALAQFAGTRFEAWVHTYTAESLIAIDAEQNVWLPVALDAVRKSYVGSPPTDICGEMLEAGIADPLGEAGIP